MQFLPIIESCLRNPWLIRKLSEVDQKTVLDFLHKFRFKNLGLRKGNNSDCKKSNNC